jgi:hypothetical protein
MPNGQSSEAGYNYEGWMLWKALGESASATAAGLYSSPNAQLRAAAPIIGMMGESISATATARMENLASDPNSPYHPNNPTPPPRLRFLRRRLLSRS